MARLTPSGSLSCGPVVAYSQTTRSPWPHAIAITPTGAAIAGISRKFLSYNDLFMLRTAGAACALSGPVDTLSSLNVSIADIAAGPLGTALVWDETTASKVHSRVFGPLWCN
ncbi:MAG: hypothetical protein HYZ29_09125 [Myxococcales bacterium]|nr:hypothetical protein [Myxococcales bacterium]